MKTLNLLGKLVRNFRHILSVLMCGGALLCGALVVAPSAAAKSPEICPVQDAQYTAMKHPGWTAGFRYIGKYDGWMSSVAFYVHSKHVGKSYWFMFDRGSGRYVFLYSTFDVTKPGWHPPGPDGPESERPLGSMTYLSAGKDLEFSLNVPMKDQAAPYYILLPELPEVMRYRTTENERQDAPLAFFKITSCHHA